MADASLLAFSKWLGATALSHAIQTERWVIPTLQTIHILGVAVVFSSVILVDLRALRILQRDLPLADVARRFLPPLPLLLLLLLVTGSLLIIGEPRRALLNETFYLKLAMIVIALLLTGAVGRAFTSGFLDRGAWQKRTGQLAAALSAFAWCGVLFAGRWIAYTQVGG
jgi:hypothetical protein